MPLVMAIDRHAEEAATRCYVRFHHGTDYASAQDLLQKGVDQRHAAAWNGSGEFWATSEHHRAEWFGRSHPASPPAICFEFDLPQSVLSAILQMNPPAARHHLPNDYEFLPPSHALLNRNMLNKQAVDIL
jgi:hypothetical protein